MPKSVSACRVICAAAIVAAALAAPGLSVRAEPAQEGAPEAGPPPNMECAAEPVTASGPGFASSRDASEQAAREAWLKKAKDVYPEATWETAYQAGVSCAVQGLYSKCFAQAIPCKPKGK